MYVQISEMAKEKTKESLSFGIFERSLEAIRKNLKLIVLAAVLILVLTSSVLLYLLREERKSDDLNYLLNEAGKMFRESAIKGDRSSLSKAEEIFERIAKENREGISELAKIYIARIKELKGEGNEGKEILKELERSSRNEIIRRIISFKKEKKD